MTTKNSRRNFLRCAAMAVATLPPIASGQGQQLQFATPDMRTFQAGDLIWPKRPGAYVLYRDETGTYEEERDVWISERDAFVRGHQSRADLTIEDRAELRRLETMGFREFVSLYEGNEGPGRSVEFTDGAGRGLYVGHVGIVDIDSEGTPWVIEALMQAGVIRTTYVDWMKSRQGSLVWHGRVAGLEPVQRANIALEARNHVGKPYNFWNFDLDDASEFYCSKLVWLAINRSNGFPIDGKSRSKRWFWFSPKQLLYVDRVDRLHDPGSYGSV